MENTTKFKANPYNLNNRLISTDDIINIMRKLNINDFKTTNLKLYQKCFIHKSYCKLKDYEEYEYPILVKIIYLYRMNHMKQLNF